MDAVKKAELESLADAGGGLLTPEAVVEFAKNPTTALHGEFTWDDSEAGRLYRLQQARSVIRVHVEMLPSIGQTTRAFVSIPSDRANAGGYRRTSDVLANPRWRGQAYEDALKHVGSLRKRFAYLPELAPLFDRMEADVRQFIVESVAKAAG